MMLQLDANESALRSYVRQQDDAERRQNMIADRAVDLMTSGEYCHDTGDAIIEALDESSRAEVEALGKAALEGAQQLGNAVLSISFNYWHLMATDKATEEVNSEWDSCRCHGAGCRRCREIDE